LSDVKQHITVPQYVTKFINSKINLNETNKICCPFHKEDTPSFSFNTSTGRWRCFGACKTGGDVIDLHKMNYKIPNKVEAEKSLCNLLGISYNKINVIKDNEPVLLNEESIELDRIYNLCLLNANCIERWLDMDYVMSIYPVDITRLKDLLNKWGVRYG
jgi:DNA primase